MYWDKRVINKGAIKLLAKGKLIVLLLKFPMLAIFFKLRLGTEFELAKLISRKNDEVTLLDIGCGWGMPFIKEMNQLSAYGVDIEGAPFTDAINSGYVDAQPYGFDLSSPYGDIQFDYVLIKDLCAHVSDSVFTDLLDCAQDVLKDDGEIIVAAELDNNGISYSMMRKLSKTRLRSMVKAMDHTNFKNQEEFEAFLAQLGYEIIERKYILTELINLLHFWYYFALNTDYSFKKTPYKLLKIPSFIFDIFASLFNGAISMVVCPKGRSFIVYYRLKRKGR